MMKEKEEKREFWPLVLLPLWDIFWSTFSSPFYTYYIPFRSSGSQESKASNDVQIGVEMKKLWSLQENWIELSGNFAHLNPRCENFRTVQNTLLAHEWHFAQPKPIFAPCETRCEILSLRCENDQLSFKLIFKHPRLCFSFLKAISTFERVFFKHVTIQIPPLPLYLKPQEHALEERTTSCTLGSHT